MTPGEISLIVTILTACVLIGRWCGKIETAAKSIAKESDCLRAIPSLQQYNVMTEARLTRLEGSHKSVRDKAVIALDRTSRHEIDEGE